MLLQQSDTEKDMAVACRSYILQCAICRGPRQLRLHCMQYATEIELHVHTYAVGVAYIAAREGSPHNVLHSSSYKFNK